MALIEQFTNFASTTITGALAPGDTAINVSNGALFPSLTGTQYFYAVLTDSLTAPTVREVIKVTARAANLLTAVRGQDGTTAQAWNAGSPIELRIVRAALTDLHDQTVTDAQSSTTDLTFTYDSDNNGTGDFYVKKGPTTVLKLTNAGNLLADPSYAVITSIRWGGDNTGTNDNVAAFNAIIAAGYTKIYFPAGTYKFASGVSTTGKNLTLVGDGPQQSVIKLSAAAGFDFLTFTGTYSEFSTNQLVVRDLSIQTACASGVAQGSAIKAVMNATSSAPIAWKEPFSSVIIDAVEIGALVDNACFAYGVILDTCQMPKITNMMINGFMTNGAAGTRVGNGIEAYSRYATNNNVKGTDYNITDCVIYQCNIGINFNNNASSANNFAEGGHVNGCTILNCYTGVKVGDISNAGTDALPGWFIEGCHISAADIGIDLQTVAQFFVENNLIYAVGGTTFSGVKYVTTINPGFQADGLISDNTLIQAGTYSGNTYGVNCVSGSGTPGTASIRVSDNGFENFTNAVIGDSTSVGTVVTPDNRVLSGGGYNFAAAGNIAQGFSGHLGINTTPPSAQSLGRPMLYMGNGQLGFALTGIYSTNTYYDGTNARYLFNGYEADYQQDSVTGDHSWNSSGTGVAGNVVAGGGLILKLKQNGNLETTGDIQLNNVKVIKWKDSGGTVRTVFQFYSDDTLYIMNPSTAGGTPGRIILRSDGGGSIIVRKPDNSADFLTVDPNGNVVVSNAALATNATNGFLYLPTCAGAPTGVPTAFTGRVPTIYDTTNNKIYVYNGAWKSTAALT